MRIIINTSTSDCGVVALTGVQVITDCVQVVAGDPPPYRYIQLQEIMINELSPG